MSLAAVFSRSVARTALQKPRCRLGRIRGNALPDNKLRGIDMPKSGVKCSDDRPPSDQREQRNLAVATGSSSMEYPVDIESAMEKGHCTTERANTAEYSKDNGSPGAIEIGVQREIRLPLPLRGVWRFMKALSAFILSQWLVIGLGIGCLLAALFPNVGAHGGIIQSQYSILYGAVALIFFISGLQITREKLVFHTASWRLHLITQIMSFLIIPGIILGFVRIIIAAKGVENGIDIGTLVGLIALASLPTTISSNVVLTRTSGGDDAAAMIEVMIGNILGPFVTPSLCFLLLPKETAFLAWLPTKDGSLGDLYRAVFLQIGLSVLLPLALGQLCQWLFPKQVEKAVSKFYLAKVSTACLILLVWSTFSSSFKSGALYDISHVTIIFNVFFNLGAYSIFTLMCFYACRPPRSLQRLNTLFASALPQRWKTFELFRQISKTETIAVCFCGAAKTTGLGLPMVTAMWGTYDQLKINLVMIPIVLYTTEQIFFAQVLVYFFKKWVDKAIEEESGGPEGMRDG